MILYELAGQTEKHPAYDALEIANGARQYDFLRSMVLASLHIGRPMLSETVVKALNYHAIVCLHSHAGEYRPWLVHVGDYQAPEHYRVPTLMEDFVNQVNRAWGEATDPVVLAAFALWRLNWIHPFINGNGRTARAVCYFILCVSSGGWLPGSPILPDLIRLNRDAYVAALKKADASGDLTSLHAFLTTLLAQQIGPATGASDDASSPATPAADGIESA